MTANANQALRVLVVDDNRDSADTLALLVKLQGHEAFVAYASRDGIRLAAKVLPDSYFTISSCPIWTVTQRHGSCAKISVGKGRCSLP
jgi:hypothetical protein